MTDRSLSQQEIDALLAGAGESYDESLESIPIKKGDGVVGAVNTGDLSTLMELVKLILQRQAEHLSSLLQKDIQLANVKVKIKDNAQVLSQLMGQLIQIRMDYSSGVVGENIILMKVTEALRFVELFTRQSNVDLSDVTLNSLSEGFVHMMTATNNMISEKLGRMILVDPPKIEVLEDSNEIRFPDESQVVHISYTLTSEDALPISIHQLYSISLAKEFITLTKGIAQEEGLLSGEDISTIGLDPEDRRLSSGPIPTTVRPIRYHELSRIMQGDAASKHNISLLLDINMQMTVELGRTKMQIRKILALGEGSIIELEKLAGEPVDLLVNSKLIAKGEVVVIDENFGVRITEIVSPHERLDSIVPD
ncbi:MAG TPA: flagellar motor switch protein FliN [Spirochaetes bacterium]|nr:flagellar motor switch protein FliN [Spirochaetota bacterium]